MERKMCTPNENVMREKKNMRECSIQITSVRENASARTRSLCVFEPKYKQMKGLKVEMVSNSIHYVTFWT